MKVAGVVKRTGTVGCLGMVGCLVMVGLAAAVAGGCASDKIADSLSDAETTTSSDPSEGGLATELAVPEQATFVPASDESASEAATAPASMSQIDFYNGFGYQTDAHGIVVVSDGRADLGDGDESAALVVTDVVIGNLDDDPDPEAAVTTSYRSGGTGIFSNVRVFDFLASGDGTAGEAVQIAITPTGDRGLGGVIAALVVDGELIVENFAGGSACCPTTAVRTQYELTDIGLAETAPQKVRAWIDPTSDPRQIRFLPGTATALTQLYPESTTIRYVFDATADQRLVVSSPSDGWSGTVVVRDETTGELIAEGERIEVLLPTTGTYEAEVRQTVEAPALLEFAIVWTTATIALEKPTAAPPVPGEPVWDTATSEIDYGGDAVALSALRWPVLSEITSAGDLEAINDEIARFAQGLDDDWQANLTGQNGSPAGESGFEVDYTVTLSSPDLFAVDFSYYSYVCCWPYPQLGHRSLVIDLETGRALALGDYLNTNRLDELAALVVESVVEEFAMPDGSTEYLMDATDYMVWDAVTLRPDGIEVATDRGELLGAAVPPTVTFFSWDQVAGVVWQGVVADASIGRTLSTVE